MIDIFNVVLVLSVIIIRIYCKKTVQLHAATKMNALHLIIQQLDAHPIFITAKACLLPINCCKQTTIPKATQPPPSSSSPPLRKSLGHKKQEG